LNLPFVVIDIAQTRTGEWIAIECNDAQESGYAAISPFSLWQNIIDFERQFSDRFNPIS
jgi:ATP-grasp domain, R2K clade family 3